MVGMTTLGYGRGCDSTLGDLKITESLLAYIHGGPYPHHYDETACLKVKESKLTITTQITSAGAIVALALMYIKTGDQYVSDKLAIPTSSVSCLDLGLTTITTTTAKTTEITNDSSTFAAE